MVGIKLPIGILDHKGVGMNQRGYDNLVKLFKCQSFLAWTPGHHHKEQIIQSTSQCELDIFLLDEWNQIRFGIGKDKGLIHMTRHDPMTGNDSIPIVFNHVKVPFGLISSSVLSQHG